MAIIRVLDNGNNFIGEIEADVVPMIGDMFSWKKLGPYIIEQREWHLPHDFDEKPYIVTLRVKVV